MAAAVDYPRADSYMPCRAGAACHKVFKENDERGEANM
jgi:hypothetical protein